MADYSYVKVEFAFSTPEEAEDFAGQHVPRPQGGEGTLTFPHHHEGDVTLPVYLPSESSTFEVEFEQARYGFGCEDEVMALCRWLTDQGIAWRVYDGGGYGWPATEHQWHPADDRWWSRS